MPHLEAYIAQAENVSLLVLVCSSLCVPITWLLMKVKDYEISQFLGLYLTPMLPWNFVRYWKTMRNLKFFNYPVTARVSAVCYTTAVVSAWVYLGLILYQTFGEYL